VILVVAVILVGAYLLNRPNSSEKGVTTTYNPLTQGKVVFGVTDATSDMGGVSSVLVTVDKVEMHSASNGWVTVSNETKQYDLLVLKQSGAVSLLANANVDVGTYDQVRLIVSKVVVVKNGVQQEAKLPSGELKIVGNVVVNADKTSSIVFDFMADKSLHLTGNGKFIFAPVLKIKKQEDVKVELKSNNELNIAGDSREDDQDVGMDEKGDIRDNFELKGNLNIDIEDNIKVEGDDNDNDKSGKNDQSNNQENGKTNNENNKFVFKFTAQNGSGLSGTATLSEYNENGNKSVKVSLKLETSVAGALDSAKPAHIHLGSCPDVGGVKYPLNSVVNGKSETTLNVSLAELKSGLPLAINVHKSIAEINVYTACANLSF